MARQAAPGGFYGTVAPMVERSPEEAGVGGSNPPRPTEAESVPFNSGVPGGFGRMLVRIQPVSGYTRAVVKR